MQILHRIICSIFGSRKRDNTVKNKTVLPNQNPFSASKTNIIAITVIKVKRSCLLSALWYEKNKTANKGGISK
jgi:hypothetical protein